MKRITEPISLIGPARVVVVSSREVRVREALAKLPGAEGHAADLRSEPNGWQLFAELGALDHLVYTADEELLLSPLAELELTRARDFFELRYWSALAAVKAARPHLARDGSAESSSRSRRTKAARVRSSMSSSASRSTP